MGLNDHPFTHIVGETTNKLAVGLEESDVCLAWDLDGSIFLVSCLSEHYTHEGEEGEEQISSWNYDPEHQKETSQYV